MCFLFYYLILFIIFIIYIIINYFFIILFLLSICIYIICKYKINIINLFLFIILLIYVCIISYWGVYCLIFSVVRIWLCVYCIIECERGIKNARTAQARMSIGTDSARPNANLRSKYTLSVVNTRKTNLYRSRKVLTLLIFKKRNSQPTEPKKLMERYKHTLTVGQTEKC